MAQQIHELRAVVSANVAAFEKAMRAAIVSTDSFRTNFARTASEVATVASRITASITAVSTGVAAMVIKTGIGFNELKENATIAFTTVLKDGEKAQDFLKELQVFAAETPFTFKGLIEQSQFLMATGFEAKELIPTLTTLGDAMAALGAGEDKLRLVALAFSQMRNAAHLQAQDMNQLTNAGIPAWKMLAEQMGKTVEEVRELSGKGGIGGEEAFQALMKGMQERFGGGMKSSMGTFTQMLSNLKDTLDVKAGEITAPLFNAFKKVFGSLLEYLGSAEFNGVIERLAVQMEAVGQAMATFIDENKGQMIAAITDAFSGLATGVANLMEWLKDAGPEIKKVATETWGWIQAIGRFIAAHPQVVVALAAWKGAEMLGIVSLLKTIIPLFTSLVGAITSLPGVLSAAGGALKVFGASLASVATAGNALKLSLGAGAVGAAVGGVLWAFTEDAKKLNAELNRSLQLYEKMTGNRLAGAENKSPEEMARLKEQAAAELEAREQELAFARSGKGRSSPKWLEDIGAAMSGAETPEANAERLRDAARRHFDEVSAAEEAARARGGEPIGMADAAARLAGGGGGGSVEDVKEELELIVNTVAEVTDAMQEVSDVVAGHKPGEAFMDPEQAARDAAHGQIAIADLADGAEEVKDKFDNLDKGMTDFSGQVVGATKHLHDLANPEEAARAWGILGQFLNSSSGQAATLQNNIAMLQQNLQLPGLSPQRRQQISDQISDLQGQLGAAPPPPMFGGISGGGVVNDPGLQHRGNGSYALHVNLPNINRVTNSDVRQITDAIAMELDRRGRRA